MVLIGVLVVVAFIHSRFNIVPNLVATTQLPSTTQEFPAINTAGLTNTQGALLTLLKQEYREQPPGTKYSMGTEESWCTDFVSWIMKEADAPLSNPNNGGWRIPGTYTLRDYYESVGKFKPADAEYSPKVGDVVLYDNPSPHGQHTNIVVKNDNGTVTTVGGNEGGKIRIQTNILQEDPGLVGYGVL